MMIPCRNDMQTPHLIGALGIIENRTFSLVEYEARLNHVLSKYNDPVICNYDLSKFSASVAMDIMRTHPLVIIGGLLRENPFFVPPEQFLEELRERQSARMTAGS